MLSPHATSQKPKKTGERKPKAKEQQSTDAFLARVKKEFQDASQYHSDNHKTWVEDTRFSCSDDQWDTEVKRLRGEHRPALTINRLNGVIKQIIGDYRKNKMAVKVLPASGEASEDIANILAGLVRNIEAQSNADVAYTNALECAARGGFGYWRIDSDYTGDDAFDQDLVIRPIHNPLTVYFDPAARLLTREEARYCFVTEWMPKDEFEEKYPDADMGNWEGDNDSTQDQWLSSDGVRVAEYFEKVKYEARLAALSNGMVIEIKNDQEIFALEQIGLRIMRERTAQRIKIRWRKLTAGAILEEREYASRYIPIVPCIGEEVNVEGKVLLRGAIFYGKEPQRIYNYFKSTATETAALAPRVPFMVTPTQIQGFEDIWASANVTPLSYLPYNPDGTAPPPQRIAPPDTPVGELSMAAGANDDIKATTGLYDASLGAQGNEVSGRAIMARQQEGDSSTYLFVDNLRKAIEYSGRIILDRIPTTYDAERMIRVLDLEGNPRLETVNQQQYDAFTGITQILNNITVGKYDVVIDTGPSYASLRMEAQDTLAKLTQVYPQIMQVAGDLVLEQLDYPGAQKIAERMRRAMPPQLTTDPDSPEGKALAAQMANQPAPVPPEVQAQQAQAAREQAEFQAKMQLEQQKFQFEQQKELNRFELEERQRLTQAMLKEKQIAADAEAQKQKTQSDAALQTAQLAAEHQHDLKKHEIKIQAERESSARMADATGKPATMIHLDAQDAFSAVAETMKGMAEQQVAATQALAGVATTIQQQSQTMEAALLANTAAITGGMALNAEAMKDVAKAVTSQTAATEKQTEVMKAPTVAVRDEEGNIVAAKKELK